MLYLSLKRLHKESVSAVLPDPTGPPMPTRSGSLYVLVDKVAATFAVISLPCI
jgi:hypothetical protein